jgi:hypothetical protein
VSDSVISVEHLSKRYSLGQPDASDGRATRLNTRSTGLFQSDYMRREGAAAGTRAERLIEPSY